MPLPSIMDGELAEMLHPLTWFLRRDYLIGLACEFSKTYRELARSSTEHFLATPVTKLPTGRERGQFLAIDVGGTNLRVGITELVPDNSAKDQQNESNISRAHEKSWPIKEHMKMDKAEDLFAWIGDCIAEVVADALVGEGTPGSFKASFKDEIPLGITFSFPMIQDSMSEATLMPMGKGFAITSNLNLGHMLLAGYSRHCTNSDRAKRRKLTKSGSAQEMRSSGVLPRIKIAAITNDTVATFVSLAYNAASDRDCKMAMGLIVGTGCNATVPMRVQDLHESKRKGLNLPKRVKEEDAEVIVNTEWTIRGTDRPMHEMRIPTKWDEELDEQCSAPGFQPFEYMTAGRYLGELVRLAFIDLIKQRSPGQCVPQAILRKDSISTTFLADIASQSDDAALANKLSVVFKPDDSTTFSWSAANCQLLRGLAVAVQKRSSALIAAAVVGLLNCVGKIDLTDRPLQHTEPTDVKLLKQVSMGFLGDETFIVGYTGRTISDYPNFLDSCQSWISDLVRNGSPKNARRKVVLRPALDGGITGAAVLAGMMA